MKQPARKRSSYDVEAREKALLKRLNTGFFGLCYQASKGKIDALCAYLEADKPLTEEDKQNIAWLIRKVHVYGMPRKKGRRSATRIGLVQSAVSYGVIIYIREQEQWLVKNPGYRRLPRGMPADLIDLAAERTEAKYPRLKGSKKMLARAIRAQLKRPRHER